ncbi:MAG: hypothetical protein AYL28_005960 [Candidatus Bathyarchaeota archaeon B23]|nr:MAG: hypothetical protein AYL28_005960 [Candidatus Bathyarchaeota archaeon B23]
MRVAGVDDAGRGCVIGPLVVAGALFEEGDVERLRVIGVQDSKALTPGRRERLAEEIEGIALDCAYFEIPPRAIDRVVERGVRLRRLNYLEAMAMAYVIRELKPDRVYVDASDINAERFGEHILSALREKPHIISEHEADARYPVVAAASILAKVRRDDIIRRLREHYGDFGSGYPHDPKTVRFLEEWFSRHPDGCPPFIRGSWSTVKRIRGRVRGQP